MTDIWWWWYKEKPTPRRTTQNRRGYRGLCPPVRTHYTTGCLELYAYPTANLPSGGMQATDQTKNSRQEKVTKRWQTTRSPQDKAIFNKATHELKLLLNDLKQQAIQSYLETLTATEATEHSLWKATKRLNRPQTHTPPLLTAAGGWAKSDTQKAHVLADHFAHVFQPMTPRYLTQNGKSFTPKKLQVVSKPQPKIQDYRSTGCDKTHAYQKGPGLWSYHRANPQGVNRNRAKSHHPYL